MPNRLPLYAAAFFMLGFAGAPARAAQTPKVTAPAPDAAGPWNSPELLGDMGGLHSALARHGIHFTLLDTENLLGNVAGGVKQGATLQGLTTATLRVHTGKAFGLPGGLINVSALQIHGRSLSPYYLDSLQTASGTEAQNATRLWEFWYDQSFDGGAFDIKLGQQSVDQEFIVSEYSGLFVNTMAGWPLLPSVDLYAGGPAYPLSSLGVRLRARVNSNVGVLAGVFDDNPPGRGFANDPQSGDAGGVRFNLNTGALFMGEVQFNTKMVSGMSGTYKLGFWYDTAYFPDQAYDNHGLSLANPLSDGRPALHKGNYSLYGVVDQTLWQTGNARSLNGFMRIMGAPGAQNLVSLSFNGGFTLTDPLPGRQNDAAGIDLGIGQMSGQAAAFGRAMSFYTGNIAPTRGTETLLEFTYQAQVTPWLQLQPDVQFIFNPGGGLLNPENSTQPLKNEIVFGLRSNIVF